jgi:hypothetical protein
VQQQIKRPSRIGGYWVRIILFLLFKILLKLIFSYDEKPTTPEDVWSTSPYPKGAVFDKRDQSLKSARSKLDPRETSVILFPVSLELFI